MLPATIRLARNFGESSGWGTGREVLPKGSLRRGQPGEWFTVMGTELMGRKNHRQSVPGDPERVSLSLGISKDGVVMAVFEHWQNLLISLCECFELKSTERRL